MFETLNEIKNRSNFLDKCLVLHCLFKIKGKNHVRSRSKSFVKVKVNILFSEKKLQYSYMYIKKNTYMHA